jgi:hypothetical protein
MLAHQTPSLNQSLLSGFSLLTSLLLPVPLG